MRDAGVVFVVFRRVVVGPGEMATCLEMRLGMRLGIDR